MSRTGQGKKLARLRPLILIMVRMGFSDEDIARSCGYRSPQTIAQVRLEAGIRRSRRSKSNKYVTVNTPPLTDSQ